jgi:hypothetical protein
MTNVDLNSAANDIVKTRRLNWLMDDPLELMEEHQDPDPFGWSSQERQDWKDNGAFILAADGTLFTSFWMRIMDKQS